MGHDDDKIGMRVIALRNVERNTVYSFGAGVYEGDYVRPGHGDMPTGKDYELYRRVAENDMTPAKREDWLQFVTGMEESMIAKGKRTEAEAAVEIEKAMAEWDATRALPIDEQIKDNWRIMAENPRIQLDNGGYVWGFECWWGPEDQARAKYPEPEFTWVEVTPRWNTAS